MKEGSEKYTAFVTEYGLFEWNVACFGLKNALAESARYMNSILREYLNEFVTLSGVFRRHHYFLERSGNALGPYTTGSGHTAKRKSEPKD